MNGSGSEKIDAPDLASPAFKANPYPFYARLREEVPVWRTTLGDRHSCWPQRPRLSRSRVRFDLNYSIPPDDALAPGVDGGLGPVGEV